MMLVALETTVQLAAEETATDVGGLLTGIGGLILGTVAIITAVVTRRNHKDTVGVELMREVRAEKDSMILQNRIAQELIDKLREEDTKLKEELAEVRMDRAKLREAKDRIIRRQQDDLEELGEQLTDIRRELADCREQLAQAQEEVINSRAVSAEAIRELALIRGNRGEWHELPPMEVREVQNVLEVRDSNTTNNGQAPTVVDAEVSPSDE